jgi:hypothetical protein
MPTRDSWSFTSLGTPMIMDQFSVVGSQFSVGT